VKDNGDYQAIAYRNINIPGMKKSIPTYEIAWEDPLEKLRNKTMAKIDRFHILNEIYLNDAMDSFKAVDTFLDRLVIMKILRPDFPIPDRTKLPKLFLEKANIIGKLIHNNIAIIYDISENKGFCYIAREYVEGTQLTDLLTNANPLSWRKAIEICCQICAGLSYAHKLGVIHGRMKPNNIFISEMSEIKITDFTIPEFSTPIKFQKNLNLKGISYLSPEQVANNGIDQRCDQYAVGVLLYELLTNFNPFYADDRDNLFDKISSFDPPPVSSFNMNVPQELDIILHKALSKSPARRYEHIDQFLHDLRKIMRLK